MEHIYTILINETFESLLADNSSPRCPVCAVKARLEKNEIERILGAAMMEPDVRIQTNKKGFCRGHFGDLLAFGNRLGLALILESHLAEIEKGLSDGIGDLFKGRGSGAVEFARGQGKSCYLCDRIDGNFAKAVDNILYMWSEDSEFRAKFAAQKCFCLEHFAALAEGGRERLNKKSFPDFYEILFKITRGYLAATKGEVSYFIKKFDYRFDELPWGGAKDSPDRAVKFLSGE